MWPQISTINSHTDVENQMVCDMMTMIYYNVTLIKFVTAVIYGKKQEQWEV